MHPAVPRRCAGSLLAVLVGLVVLVLAPGVSAQEALDVEVVRAPDFTSDGRTRIVVDLEGQGLEGVDASSFTITEDGEPVGDVELVAASQVPDPDPRTVMLAMDTSDSTEGEPRERSIAAAKAFARSVMDQNVDVGVVSFSATAVLEQEPTSDVGEAEAALDDMESGFGTALFDGVILASQTLAEVDGQRSIIMFSDGADVGSSATLGGAANAASLAGAPVTSVFLDTVQVDRQALEVLADETGGRVIQVDGTGGLDDAFAQVAEDFNRQFVLTYPSTTATGQIEIEVVLEAGGSTAVDSLPALKPVEAGAVERQEPNVRSVGDAGLFGSSLVGTLAVAGAALAVALLMWSLFVPVSDRQVVRNLEAAIGRGEIDTSTSDELSPTTAALSRRAVEMVERIPKPEGYDAAMQQRIDRAAWPLRSGEFTALRLISALVGLGLGWVLVHPVFGLLLAAVAWVLPNVFLGVRVRARQNKFMEQLPDTLQLLAGSMKAGYGVLQAIDTVVKESEDPTRSEFTRVLAEARLGLELDDSLMDMAQRIGTDDFRWVAVSISIQRRVGGNLAQLLETVAATLRERAATRRQIRALSAEGRLSAVILTALPFALAGYMLLVNPDYLSTLWSRGIGQVMIVGSLVLMVFGVFWMKNLIEIDV